MDQVRFYKDKNKAISDDLKREQKNNQIYLLKIQKLKENIKSGQSLIVTESAEASLENWDGGVQ